MNPVKIAAASVVAQPGFRTLVRKAFRHPRTALAVSWWLLKGYWYKAWYPVRGIRFQAGRNFRVQGRLRVRGPGRVIFGDGVVVGALTTPWTHDRNAVITVGDGTYLNGTRMGAARAIRIGCDCIIAEAHILDTDFHSVEIDRHNPSSAVRVAAVDISDNVWIAAQAGILPGVSIGQNSVVGFGSICTGRYPANSMIAGNPARVIRPLRSNAPLSSKAVGSNIRPWD